MTNIAMVMSEHVPQPLANYSQGMRAGDLIFLAGQLATDWKTGVPADLRISAQYPYYGSAMERQTRFVLDNIKRALEDNDSDLAHVVKAQVFLTDSTLFADFDRVWQEYFPVPPPRTTVEVGPIGLLVPGTLVEIDVIAVPVDGATQPEPMDSDRIPSPLANYTPCTRYGDWLFLAGQLASDFGPDGVPYEAKVNPDYAYYGSDIELQTEYTLRNLQALLEDAGSDLGHVVKAQIFLKDLNDFNGFDDVWKKFFPECPPPRTTLQVAELLVPGSKLEIDLIAVRKDGATQIERISTPDAPSPLANYTQAVKVGDLVFLAGQLASDFRTGVPAEAKVDPNFRFYGSDIEKQTEFTLKNCETVLAAAGSSLSRSVKAQVFMTDLRNFSGMDKVWKRHFETLPPRTTVELAGDGLLVPGTLVEIDLIAVAE